MKLFLLALALSLCPILSAQTAVAQNFLEFTGLSPYTSYKTFETEHFIFIYQDGFLEFTELAAKHYEHAHTILSPILKWQPRQKTTVVIADNEDSANGFAMPPLRVGMVLIATPPDAWMSTSYSEDWIKLLVFHEYTHMLNIDPTTEWMEGLRILFGDIVRPNGLWPVWMLEGLAVYFETRTSQFGRGRSPYYDSVVRAYYQDGRLGSQKKFGITLDRVNGDFPFFPGGEVPYLFGYHLWNQFAKDQNNDEKMGDYSLHSSHRIPYFIEWNLENVAGKNWIDYWNSFIAESKTRFSEQLQKVKDQGETKIEWITNAGYSAQGGVISPNGEWLAYSETSKERRAGLYLYNFRTKEKKRIIDKFSGVGMGFSPDGRYLIFSALERYDTYGFFSDLFLYDFQKDEAKIIAHGARAKDPSFSPDGKKITYIKVNKASHQLVSASISIQENKVTLKDTHLAYDASKYSILGSPRFVNENEIVFSQQTLGRGQSDLIITEEKTRISRVLVGDGKMNRFPFPDGKGNLVYVSDLDGIENVYRISLDEKLTTKVSNIFTGVNLPFTGPDGTLYASVMTSNGYEIAKLSESTLPIFKTTQRNAFPSAPVSMTEALVSPELKFDRNQIRDYSPWSSMVPRQWAPVYQITTGTNQGTAIHGSVLGFDSSFKQQYVLGLHYHFKPKQFDFDLEYTISHFRPIITLSAEAYTHDIGSGDNRDEYRRTQEVMASLSYPIQWTYSSLHPNLYGFLDWRRIYQLETNQRLGSTNFEFARPMVPGYGASLTYSRLERSRLAFMPEEGIELTAIGEARVNGDDFTLYKYLAMATQYIRVGDHSVLKPRVRWLGSSHPTGYERGYAMLEGKSTSDYSSRGVRSSLRRLELRGYSDMVFRNRATGIASTDFHFPVDWLFSGVYNTLPVFLKQMHGFVFGETAYIPSQRYGDLFLPSFGFGLNLETTLFIRAPVTFSAEMHNGTNKNFGGDQLFFFSITSDGLF